jgi:hypothetical protein
MKPADRSRPTRSEPARDPGAAVRTRDRPRTLDQSRGGIFSFSLAQVLGGVASVARLATGYLRRIIWPEYPVNGQ